MIRSGERIKVVVSSTGKKVAKDADGLQLMSGPSCSSIVISSSDSSSESEDECSDSRNLLDFWDDRNDPAVLTMILKLLLLI